MDDLIPMTREDFERRQAEISHMENVEMPSILDQLAKAREEGDLKENAEYHGQREAQGLLQAKINLRRSELGRARVLDPTQIDRSRIDLGASVDVTDLDKKTKKTIHLVSSNDADILEDKFAITGPVGQALLGRQVKDEISVEVPRGLLRYRITAIRYDGI